MAWLGSASSSASRRSASAIPSSSSERIGGSDSSKFAAKVARSCSGKSSASFSISITVAIVEEYYLTVLLTNSGRVGAFRQRPLPRKVLHNLSSRFAADERRQLINAR